MPQLRRDTNAKPPVRAIVMISIGFAPGGNGERRSHTGANSSAAGAKRSNPTSTGPSRAVAAARVTIRKLAQISMVTATATHASTLSSRWRGGFDAMFVGKDAVTPNSSRRRGRRTWRSGGGSVSPDARLVPAWFPFRIRVNRAIAYRRALRDCQRRGA